MNNTVSTALCVVAVIGALATIMLAVGGPAASARTVRGGTFDLSNGKAAGLRVGKSTEKYARARFGRPRSRGYMRDTGNWLLSWPCGKGCTFQVFTRRGKVVTVWASVTQGIAKTRFRTIAGTHLGSNDADAEAAEGGTFESTCDRSFSKQRDGITLNVSANGDLVDSLLMYTERGRPLC